ncbi:MAG TPA: hypothetical protein VFY31_08365 [Macromonas sp.]|nr:hypothetical protein [Macromonas sp.]
MSTQEPSLPFFLTQNTGFAQIKPEDELLHPDSFKDLKDDAAIETQYFGFSVPEARIHGCCYLRHHPNLNIVMGGLFVYQGVKATTVHAELCDFWNFMSDRSIKKNDLHEYRFDNGYGVKILEPLKRMHITYDDAKRQNSVNLIAEAVQPAVMFGDGNHFEQTMRMTGELVLRGQRYEVDCFDMRDRSWGKGRPETSMTLPPVAWMCGTFNKDFAFNCSMLDQASGNPLLKGELALDDDKALKGGWVYRDGKLGRIVRARKRVNRDRLSLASVGIELQFTDEHGREFDMRGTLVAACPRQSWSNVWLVFNYMRWECDGLVGYGDSQDGFWGDYLQLVD